MTNRDEVARQLEANKARWSEQRRAYEASQTDKPNKPAARTEGDVPVFVSTPFVWAARRGTLQARNSDEVARQLEANKARWSEQRRAYEASQTDKS